MGLIEVKLRPTTPWRTGNRTGDREQVDVVYHSDSLYSAITHGMSSLGWLEEWLSADVKLSSLFPFIGEARLLLHLGKLVPADSVSLPAASPAAGSPFRVSIRAAAAVDRLSGGTEPHRTACLEFAKDAGWWGLFDADELWTERVKTVLRLLADSGFGGERSRGWGRASEPEFADGAQLFASPDSGNAWRLLSLYSPHEEDQVDWTRSQFSVTTRAGWTDSQAGVAAKKQVRMIEEGSVLRAASIKGRRIDVAPAGFRHPVYRSGIAMAIPLRIDE